MEIKLYDKGATIQIMSDEQERYILKSQVREVNVVRDTIVKIDLALGARNCIYIDSDTVTLPSVDNATDLRDSILFMLTKDH